MAESRATHRAEIVMGPECRPEGRADDNDFTRGYNAGWNACLTATEEARGTGQYYRCTCGVEARDWKDMEEHLINEQRKRGFR